MKAIYKLALLCSALSLLAACGGKDPVDPVNPETPGKKEKPAPETHTLTFVLPADGAKTAWVAGDQIVVHGEYAEDQVTVTLEAGDIAADKKSATKKVDGLRPYKREDCSSSLYASYPASAVDNLTHCFFYSKFSTTNEQLMAACNDGDTFRFQNITGALSVSVNGDYEGYLLSTPKKEALGYEFLQVKITDQEQIYSQYRGTPVLQIEKTMSGSDIMIYLPDGTEFSAGFTLKLKKGGDYVKIYKHTEPVEIARGAVTAIGDVSDKLQDYVNPFAADIQDLDTDGNANCYVVKAAGGYKFKAVMGNNPIAFLEEPYNAVVLWETWNDVSDVTEGSVIASADYAEDYVIIHTPETLHPGNAVVAVKNAEGDILWSWHIWIPETEIKTGNFSGVLGEDFMDRNLGALVVTSDGDNLIDPRSYGMMYQWGRKDPFVASGVANSNTLATYVGEPDEVAVGQITLEESIKHPRRLGHVDNGDWLLESNDLLWSETEKTLYDPCPPGYHAPTPVGSAPFWASDLTIQAGWGVNVAAGWLKLGTPEAAVFPIAGYRDDYTVGGMSKVGTRTLYWVSRGSGARGSGADLRSDKSYTFGSAPKARLGSVRCVVE